MKNITELRTRLTEVFNGLESGDVDVKVASEMNNSAGKIINTLKVQLEHASLQKKEPNIDFLKG